jgi:3-methyladenine DNA glycosylase AlkC
VTAVASYLGVEGIRRLAKSLREVSPQFPERRFCALATAQVDSMGLFARATHIATVLDTVLELPFREVTQILVAAAGPPRTMSGYGPMANFRLLALTRLISLAGRTNFRESMWALRELTRRFTSEFDIRPFLLSDEAATLRTIRRWTEHEDFHVRRLASEGTRSRLPWGAHLRSFQSEPSKALAVIEHLKTDASRYVQISVANNLADIIKDNPEIGLQVAERWAEGGHEVTLRIVRHAVRFPAKCGNKRAIALRRAVPPSLG